MPLEGEPLASADVALIEKWITEGAKYDAEDPKAPLATIVPAPTHPAPPEAYPRSVPITAVAFSPDRESGCYWRIPRSCCDLECSRWPDDPKNSKCWTTHLCCSF